ncbi:hypothetical protein ACJ2BB_05210, partial [Klebsiella pneumoniae]|uniref:hypothetical protein n=1 Tax=Klebsiella pneumoniae TaxID=573 RepID=UPI003896B886
MFSIPFGKFSAKPAGPEAFFVVCEFCCESVPFGQEFPARIIVLAAVFFPGCFLLQQQGDSLPEIGQLLLHCQNLFLWVIFFCFLKVC